MIEFGEGLKTMVRKKKSDVTSAAMLGSHSMANSQLIRLRSLYGSESSSSAPEGSASQKHSQHGYGQQHSGYGGHQQHSGYGRQGSGYGHNSHGGGHSGYGKGHQSKGHHASGSGYGGYHSGSGSGYGHSGGFGHHGYGHGGHGHKKKKDCCPLVVDPLTLAALMGAIGVATGFLNTLITMNISKRRRRRRQDGESEPLVPFVGNMAWDIVNAGKTYLHQPDI